MSTWDEKELYRRVDELLYYLWDPSCVSSIPLARDQYEQYVPKVVALLNEDVNGSRLYAHLSEVVTKQMGLSKNTNATLHVVTVLLDLKAALTAA
jgi:hypothetical protein